MLKIGLLTIGIIAKIVIGVKARLGASFLTF
jgi:hypothetical protein